MIQRTISKGFRESTKRLLAVMAGTTLCLCTMGLTLAVEVQAATGEGKVDGALVGALLGLAGWTAGLAGLAYRKPDSTGGAAMITLLLIFAVPIVGLAVAVWLHYRILR